MAPAFRPLPRRWSALVAAALLAPAIGCFGEMSDLVALSSAVRTAYPGASLAVDIENGHRTVKVEFQDDEIVAGLGVEEAEAKAREIGRFIVEHYGEHGGEVDDIVVVFEAIEVREDGGRLERRAKFQFAADDVRRESI